MGEERRGEREPGPVGWRGEENFLEDNTFPKRGEEQTGQLKGRN